MSNIPYLLQLDENSSVAVRDLATMAFALSKIPPPDSLDIIADGIVSSEQIISFTAEAIMPSTPINGKLSIPVIQTPYISIENSSGNATATKLEFSNLTHASNFAVTNTNTLKSLSCPALVRVSYDIQFTDNPNLISAKFPSLTYANRIYFGSTPSLTEVDFTSLVESNLQLNTLDYGFITGFNQNNFPSLRKAEFTLGGGVGMSSSFYIDMPLLTTLKNISGAFSRVYLPNLVNITTSYLDVSNNPNLVEFNIGTAGVLKTFAAGSSVNLVVYNAALSETSVNNLLILLASLDGTNGTTISNDGNLTITGGTSAAPSGDGIIAKNKLIARNWNINTN